MKPEPTQETTEASAETERSYRVLIYAPERVGLSLAAPRRESVKRRNYELFFETYSSSVRFNEFDAVVYFQGIFEEYQTINGVVHGYRCDHDQLDKRKKELALLLGKGGFTCCLLCKDFTDSDGRGHDYRVNDLAKFELSYSGLIRENYGSRITQLDVKVDELRPFFDLYGAAHTHFRYSGDAEWRVIAERTGRVVGMYIDRAAFFIPTLIPSNRADVIAEYFDLLVGGLVLLRNKSTIEIPAWVKAFPFDEEADLRASREAHSKEIETIDSRIRLLDELKSVLVLSGDDLPDAVARVFERGFGIKAQRIEEFREDLKLVDAEGKVIGLCEAKGINAGVKREHVNQTDSHRERSGFEATMPALLLANTHIKNARKVSEKDQEIARDQVSHARKMNVLILRTLDLLELLKLHLRGKLGREEVLRLLTTNSGWLRVSEAGPKVLSGAEAPPKQPTAER